MKDHMMQLGTGNAPCAPACKALHAQALSCAGHRTCEMGNKKHVLCCNKAGSASLLFWCLPQHRWSEQTCSTKSTCSTAALLGGWHSAVLVALLRAIESQNHEGWKKTPRSPSPTVRLSPLNHVPQCHISTIPEYFHDK